MAERRRYWPAAAERFTAAAGHTAAGTVASALVGSALGAVGALALAPVSVSLAVGIVPLALLAAAREYGWISIPLIQPRRQTNQCWKVYGRPAAGVLWGFDLGLVFTTWFTFSGTWVVVGMAFVSRDPLFGGALFAAYWLGRALPVWVARYRSDAQPRWAC